MALPVIEARRRLAWLLVLPVSRRRLLLMTMLAWLSILAGLVLLAGHIRSGSTAPAVSTGYSDDWERERPAGSGTPDVLVPTSFWRWAWTAPAIQSPWGEKTQPKTFHDLGLAHYNPYSVAPDNSARFLEWQLERAREAVLGGSGVPVARRLRTRGMDLLAAMLAFLGMFYLVLRARRKRGAWVGIAGLGLLAALFCDFLQVVESAPLGAILTIRLAAILPQNPVALVVLAALLLGGAYWAVEKQFEKLDLIPSLKREDGKR
jgi:hypothetical protein